MTEREMRLVVLADPHCAATAEEAAGAPTARNCRLGMELVQRALEDAQLRGGFDAVLLLGDLLNDGTLPTAADLLARLASEVSKLAGQAPVLIAPGNHDGPANAVLEAFGAADGGRTIGGCRFYVFTDPYAPGDVCTRPESSRQVFREWAGQGGGPIIVLQHNPMHPPVESAYPYMLTNRPEVMEDYRRAGVLLSISGHYHPGQPFSRAGGVLYYTCPALCEGDYPYAVIRLSGGQARVEQRALRFDGAVPVVDGHAHTEFAYCARGPITGRELVERARTLNLAGICLVEHAPQLYCSADDFWAARHIREPAIWQSEAHRRNRQFRAAMAPLRDGFCRIGLEVELDRDGRLTLLDEDRWVDLLVGAVHWLVEEPADLTDRQLANRFMQTCEGLCSAGIDVLAHPWRLFGWAKRPVPRELYRPLVELLAATGVAAEINFHLNQPDPKWFAMCIERGVKIAFGSDAHRLEQAGLLQPHLGVLIDAAGTADPRSLRRVLRWT